MKTTIELPDLLFRKAKSRAAERGQTLKEFVTDAIQEKLAAKSSRSLSDPQWMRGFAKLRRLHRENVRIQSAIDREFEIVEPEDRL